MTNPSLFLTTLLLATVTSLLTPPAQAQTSPKPLKALLIAGGCCHDYTGQQNVISEGIQARANIQVDVWWTDDKSVNPPLSLYDNPDWAKGYDAEPGRLGFGRFDPVSLTWKEVPVRIGVPKESKPGERRVAAKAAGTRPVGCRQAGEGQR